jgi:hypothetical protein
MRDRQVTTETDMRDIARRGLAELLAPEPNQSAVELLGGELVWDHPSVQYAVSRNPANARALRPHLIKACQQLADHPLVGVRCTCGEPLGFLGLAAFATGVIAVTHPHRQRKSYRTGGVADFTLDPTQQAPFAFIPWTDTLQRSAERRGAVSNIEVSNDSDDPLRFGSVIGDHAHSRAFQCPGCARTYAMTNVELIRRYLKAVADRSPEVLFGPKPNARPFSPNATAPNARRKTGAS